ncbi:MAG: VCBS repeat-containing protein [Nitrospirae bacterium]|nr:VCBS repeat-containing protein [Nitrospirota bacterium]
MNKINCKKDKISITLVACLVALLLLVANGCATGKETGNTAGKETGNATAKEAGDSVVKEADPNDDAIKALASKTAEFFKPLDFRIKEVKGSLCSINAGSGSSAGKSNLNKIRAGLRLYLFREGEVFYHPVTNEPLGHFEKSVGMVEVAEVSGDTLKCKVITGQPKPSDIARVSSSKIKALFYQDKTIDWFLGDAFYRALKENGRFELIDTPLISEDISQIIEDAKKKDADVLIYVSGKPKAGEMPLNERLYWVTDGKEIFSDGIGVKESYVKELKASSGTFVASNDAPLLSYTLPSRYEMLAIGDLDGNGTDEIIMATGNKVTVYQPTVDLHELWSIKGDKFSDFIYVGAIDLNKNGKDEVILTSYSTSGAISYVYELSGNEMVLLWKTKGFLRVSRGRLLYQQYDNVNGFADRIVSVSYTGKTYEPGKPLDLPKGINIYDFAEIDTKEMGSMYFYFDKFNHLNLSATGGTALWRSKENFGGFLKEFRKPERTVMIDSGSWYMGDRFYTMGQQAFVIRRILVTSTMPALGFKRSEILNLWWNGITVDESTLVSNISGNILDYAIYKDRIYILVKPILGFEPSNLLKGQNPVITNLYVYPFTN